MNEINVPLLRKVLEHVTAHPEEHDQTSWAVKTDTACGTAYCIAGHAAVMAGHELRWELDQTAEQTRGGEFISVVAARELGLGVIDAGNLFASCNSLAECWDVANEITSGEIEIPAQFRDVP